MRLVFAHGWGFTPDFWEPVAVLLPQYKQSRVDLGFFGAPRNDLAKLVPDDEPALLVGHSLGFLWGIEQSRRWTGWVAINGFAHFIDRPGQVGCVPEHILADMRQRLAVHPRKTLAGFYRMIDAAPVNLSPNAERLAAGLEMLRDIDVMEKLAAMSVPGRVLAGQNDPLVPAAASAALAKHASHGISWRDGGHLLPQTEAQWCAEQIDRFARGLTASTRIVDRFSHAAPSYHKAATVQAEIAKRLVETARPHLPPKDILDLGCGTGLVTQEIIRRWPEADVTGMDASAAMLDQARQILPQVEWIIGDAAQIMPTKKYDAIFSSMMLHWLDDPRAALQRWRAWLKPGGQIFAALLGDGSFKEWRNLCAQQGVKDGLWPMPKPDFADDLANEVRQENHVISYGSAAEFLHRLKSTGASASRHGYHPLSPPQMRCLLAQAPQPFPVTYEVLYLTVGASGSI